MSNIYFDSETVGLCGPPVLFQYAIDDGPVILFDVWQRSVQENLDLINLLISNNLIMFNAVFDSFQIYKLYTMLMTYLEEGGDPDDYLMNHIDEFGDLESRARFCKTCIKPVGIHDVMLHARKGPFQSLMERDPIIIRRVPTDLAHLLARKLEELLPFDAIYFARSKEKPKRGEKSPARWKVYDIEKPDGTINPHFKTIKLHFKASSGLKALYKHAFRITDDVFTFKDVDIDKKWRPTELGYAPFCTAEAGVGKLALPEKNGDPVYNWNWTWPRVIREHIAHWGFDANARKYAGDDVVYTRRLYQEYFKAPEINDVDSVLAWSVACCRWRGYAIDIPKLIDLKKQCLMNLGFDEYTAEQYKSREVTQQTINKFGSAIIAPSSAKKYLFAVMSHTEITALTNNGMTGTGKKVLEYLANAEEWEDHPAKGRAQEILNYRGAKKELEIYDKLVQAGRFHASFKIIGALSGRMAGSDRLNAQGINKQKKVRSCFTLAEINSALLGCLCGGDFSQFEVSIAAKVFNDKNLDAALMSGKSIHTFFGMELFPPNTYEQIEATKGTKNDLYTKAKSGVFAFFYGAEAQTFVDRIGVVIEVAERAIAGISKRFPGIRKFTEQIVNDFGALKQPKGIGTKVEWSEPKPYCETFLGFRRYFTLENRVTKTIFNLAQAVPQEWKALRIKVMRRDRLQTPAGAVATALYAAAFGIVGRNIRAAKNHLIQGPGARMTKAVQARIWSLQPAGIHEWVVQPFQVHDEVMSPVTVGYEEEVKKAVNEEVETYRKYVPLLKLDWVVGLKTWADK